MQLSGARIKISERGDFMSGTSDRYVDIAFLLFALIEEQYLDTSTLVAGKLPSQGLKELFI